MDNISLEKVQNYAVVLAAGKGTRMKSDLPKVLMEVNQKPMILHVIDNLMPLNLKNIIIVVGYKSDLVIDVVSKYVKQFSNLGKDFIQFVQQQEQLGTGHAFLMSESILGKKVGYSLVTAGDMPLIRTGSFKKLFDVIQKEGTVGSILGAKLENPFGFGRFIRNDFGKLKEIVEEKDAEEDIKNIKEVNTGCYVFRIPEIFNILRQISNDNKQNEYYLPDIIKIYAKNNLFFSVVMLEDYREALGANTIEELEKLNQIFALIQ